MHFSPLLLHTPGLFFLPPCSYFLFRLSLPVRLFLLSFPAFFSFVIPQLFFFFVIPRLDRGICKGDVRLKAEHDRKKKRPNMTKKIQGTASRYAHRKHRASTKVPAAASERSRASPCQAGYSLRYTRFLLYGSVQRIKPQQHRVPEIVFFGIFLGKNGIRSANINRTPRGIGN